MLNTKSLLSYLGNTSTDKSLLSYMSNNGISLEQELLLGHDEYRAYVERSKDGYSLIFTDEPYFLGVGDMPIGSGQLFYSGVPRPTVQRYFGLLFQRIFYHYRWKNALSATFFIVLRHLSTKSTRFFNVKSGMSLYQASFSLDTVILPVHSRLLWASSFIRRKVEAC